VTCASSVAISRWTLEGVRIGAAMEQMLCTSDTDESEVHERECVTEGHSGSTRNRREILLILGYAETGPFLRPSFLSRSGYNCCDPFSTSRLRKFKQYLEQSDKREQPAKMAGRLQCQ
jgi:hypothetical protein